MQVLHDAKPYLLLDMEDDEGFVSVAVGAKIWMTPDGLQSYWPRKGLSVAKAIQKVKKSLNLKLLVITAKEAAVAVLSGAESELIPIDFLSLIVLLRIIRM